MSTLSWDETGNRFYEVGVDRGVLYFPNEPGLAWNGLVSVKEAPSDEDVTSGFFEGQKYNSSRVPGNFGATVEAITYPRELEGRFDFSYRTLVANDVLGPERGYRIHLVYNAIATPTSKTYSTINDSVETTGFSWELTTTPQRISDGTPTSHLIIDSTLAYPWVLSELEGMIYGAPTTQPYLPSAQEVIDLFEENSILRITDHGDGTWTAEGPDSAIQMLTSDMFAITWPSALYVDTNTYRISSW